MSTKIDHHTIPQLHLRNFVGQDPVGQVWTYQKSTGKAGSATPKEIGFEKHFYSIRREDGTMDTALEDYLGDVESKAAPVYRGLLDDQLPTDQQSRVYFAEFLALMYFRTSIMRQVHGEWLSQFLQTHSYAYAKHDGAFESLLRRYEKGEGVVLTDDQKAKLRAAMIDPSGYRFEIPKEMTLEALEGADTLAPILFDMKWSIARPAKGGFFITSDNPLIKDVDPASIHPFYGDGGFLNKTVQVVFPLSPKRALCLSWNKNTPDVGALSRGQIDGINEGIAARSHRFLYAHIRHKNLERLAEKYKDTRPKMALSGFVPKQFGSTKVVRNAKPTK